MLGDFRRFPTVARVSSAAFAGSAPATVGPLPQSAGISGLKIADSNQAITSDRVWFSFNHMNNAIDLQSIGFGAPGPSNSLSRYLIGAERTFDDGRWSLEVRMPFAGRIDNAIVESGAFGDLSFIVKRLLIATDSHAMSFGLGIETPTGSDGVLNSLGATLTQQSNSVHLVPFMAETLQINRRWFANLFSQLDLPVGQDELILQSGGVTTRSQSRAAITSSTDFGIGYWINPPCSVYGSGFAAILEGHYTARIGDADDTIVGPSSVNQIDSIDHVLNVTAGIHADLNGYWKLRVAQSVPILNDELFDNETIIQVIRSL